MKKIRRGPNEYSSQEEFDEVLAAAQREYPDNDDPKTVKAFLSERLMSLADRKQEEAARLVLGYKATLLQLERYRDKYERARAGEWKPDRNKIIIEKHEAAQAQIRRYVDLIEEYREFVADLIEEGKMDKAEKALEAAASFDEKTTQADIKRMIAAVKGTGRSAKGEK